MQAAIHREQYTRILYDADSIKRPSRQWFSPDHWAEAGEVETFRQGRGGCWKVHTKAGDAVIKHYRRGGQMARISFDRYLFLGWERCRSFGEWRMLAELHKRGLPVPQPLAALCVKHGRIYRAALITTYIEGAQTIADVLIKHPDRAAALAVKVGQILTVFHASNVQHMDINLSNMVLDAAGKIWLLDFDRGRFVVMTDKRREVSLRRVERSLQGLLKKNPELELDVISTFKQQLRTAYQDCREN